ncbi:hypothetical protein AHAS_Ahas15G0343600 [Arachis hypogaea]
MAPKEGESSSKKRKEKAPVTGPYDANRFSSKVHEEHFYEITRKKKEFYANAWVTYKHVRGVNPSSKNWLAMVRGRTMAFRSRSVREALQLLQLRDDPHSYTERVNSDWRPDQILTDICLPGAQWRLNSEGQPY